MRASRKNRGWAAGIGLALTSAVVATAVAEAPATVANNGIMTFPHVRVINAPTPTSSEATRAPAQVVSKDSATSAVRAVTADELQTLSTASEASAEEAPSVTYAEDGTMTITLTGEQMVHQVAHKDGDRIVVQEAIGKQAAERATQAGLTKEVTNER